MSFYLVRAVLNSVLSLLEHELKFFLLPAALSEPTVVSGIVRVHFYGITKFRFSLLIITVLVCFFCLKNQLLNRRIAVIWLCSLPLPKRTLLCKGSNFDTFGAELSFWQGRRFSLLFYWLNIVFKARTFFFLTGWTLHNNISIKILIAFNRYFSLLAGGGGMTRFLATILAWALRNLLSGWAGSFLTGRQFLGCLGLRFWRVGRLKKSRNSPFYLCFLSPFWNCFFSLFLLRLLSSFL